MKKIENLKASDQMAVSIMMNEAWMNIIDVVKSDNSSFPFSDKEKQNKLIRSANNLKRITRILELNSPVNVAGFTEDDLTDSEKEYLGISEPNES